MADTKLSTTKVPTMKPKLPRKRLGLVSGQKRKMVSFRFKLDTIMILESLSKIGRTHFHSKFSNADTIEMCLAILKDMSRAEIIEKGTKYLTERDKSIDTVNT